MNNINQTIHELKTMDLTQLEMFNAVALTGSITQAAAKVHRVPSNLTTRIRQLEADTGVSLFIRENQRLRLSPAGHNFTLQPADPGAGR